MICLALLDKPEGFFGDDGPNTNLGSGSIIYMLEAQDTHILEAVNVIARGHRTVVEVTEHAYRKFLDDIERRQRHAK